MHRALILFLIPFLSSYMHALCGQPQPRLVCAEYFQSEAVVTARLVRTIHHSPKNEMDYFTYEMKLEKGLRGEIPQQFQIYEENSSARATFGWRTGSTYLLFLEHHGQNDWVLDGCGNSGRAQDRAVVVDEIERIQTRPTKSFIQGNINGLGGVRVFAVGNGHQYRARTSDDGQFRISVKPGQYHLSFEKAHYQFGRDPFSYEDPSSVLIQTGGCAQVFIDPKQTRN